MTTTVTIICDHCGNDLTFTGNCVDYFVSLKSKQKGHAPGTNAVTAMMIYPPCGDHSFCDMTCLKKWLTSPSTDSR